MANIPPLVQHPTITEIILSVQPLSCQPHNGIKNQIEGEEKDVIAVIQIFRNICKGEDYKYFKIIVRGE